MVRELHILVEVLALRNREHRNLEQEEGRRSPEGEELDLRKGRHTRRVVDHMGARDQVEEIGMVGSLGCSLQHRSLVCSYQERQVRRILVVVGLGDIHLGKG